MRKVTIWLVLAVVIPLVILFWPMPYKPWNAAVDLLLYVVPSLAAQMLFCRVGKWTGIKVIPAVFTGVWAAWGVYLKCSSIYWTVGGLLRVFGAPFICCLVVLAMYAVKKKMWG